MDVVGVVLPPASGEGKTSPRPLHRMLLGDDGWAEQLGPVLLYFGGHVAWWQLGDEATELREAVDWNKVVGLVRQRLKRVLAAPQFVAPRSILDAAPAAGLLALLTDGAEPPVPASASPARENAADATTFWVPTAVPARALPWHLAFLFGRAAEGVPGTEGAAPRFVEQEPASWLSVAFDRDPDLPRAERLADLARRFVLASAANPARLCVPAPFQPDCRWRDRGLAADGRIHSAANTDPAFVRAAHRRGPGAAARRRRGPFRQGFAAHAGAVDLAAGRRRRNGGTLRWGQGVRVRAIRGPAHPGIRRSQGAHSAHPCPCAGHRRGRILAAVAGQLPDHADVHPVARPRVAAGAVVA